MYFFAIAGIAHIMVFPPQINCFSGDLAEQHIGIAIIAAVAPIIQAIHAFFLVVNFVILRTPSIK